MKIKKIIAMVLIMTLAAINSVAYGFNSDEEKLINKNNHAITPLWQNINEITADIFAEDTTIYCEVYIKASKSSGVIKGTAYLEKYVSNKWTSETSWSISGTGSASLSKSHSGKSGVKYRVKVVVTIGGETATVYSETCEL